MRHFLHGQMPRRTVVDQVRFEIGDMAQHRGAAWVNAAQQLTGSNLERSLARLKPWLGVC